MQLILTLFMTLTQETFKDDIKISFIREDAEDFQGWGFTIIFFIYIILSYTHRIDKPWRYYNL